jgi:hypothetical protein
MTELDKLVEKMERKDKYIASLESNILDMMLLADACDGIAKAIAGQINDAEDEAFLRILFQNSEWVKTERVDMDISVGEQGGYSNAECGSDWAVAIIDYLDEKKVDRLIAWACEAD